MDCTICVAKTKALISFVVTAKLICIFVFAYAKRWFSHDAAHSMFQCHPVCQLCFIKIYALGTHIKLPQHMFFMDKQMP